MLANSGELKKKDGTTYSNRRFRAEFSEIFHGSKNMMHLARTEYKLI